MILNTLSYVRHSSARLSAALLILAGLSGCVSTKVNRESMDPANPTLAGSSGHMSSRDSKNRESRFINMDSEVLHATYSKEKRTETLPNGIVCTFDGKVQLRLPSGKSVKLYQTMTATGVRYLSKNKEYEFIEKGPCCRLFYKGEEIFEGVYCRSK